MMACKGPAKMVRAMPLGQPMPLRSATPCRQTIGSNATPAQTKRCRTRSAGERPTAMPWRAATNPKAQASAAPAPQAIPMPNARGSVSATAGESGRFKRVAAGACCKIQDPKCTSPQRHTTRLRRAPPQTPVFSACLLCAAIALGCAQKNCGPRLRGRHRPGHSLVRRGIFCTDLILASRTCGGTRRNTIRRRAEIASSHTDLTVDLLMGTRPAMASRHMHRRREKAA